MTIIKKLLFSEKVSLSDIYDELYNICDREHSSCNSECPVYEANENSVPNTVNDFKINRGCDCFKNGKAMAEFIISKRG